MPNRDYYLPSRNLVSQEERALVARSDIPRSRFISRKTRKTTFDAGYIVPFFLYEILPGDFVKFDTTLMFRSMTPIFPVFDQQVMETFFFFCPNRLVWSNWRKLMGEQDNPGDSTSFTVPQLVSGAGGFAINSIYDHFALPCVGQVNGAASVSVNSLPLRMYNLIYNQWFRDQNLINSAIVRLTDTGTDLVTDYALRRRAKAPDYFTMALPWPQKITSSIALASGQAPISGIGILDNTAIDPTDRVVWETGRTSTTTYLDAHQTTVAGAFINTVAGATDTQPSVYATAQPLFGSTLGITAEELRRAMLFQAFIEKDARGGTRYVEKIKMHFGVDSPDARLQRPEYIGGGSSDISFTPIAQTAPVAGVGVGTLAAAGTVAGRHSASYAATEHGFVLGLVNVRTEQTYQQGLHRMWTRFTIADYAFPSLSGLSEQPVRRDELFCNGIDAEDTLVFGYVPRYEEYRQVVSDVTGMFRSTHAGTIHQWHLAMQYSAAPTLNQAWIEDAPPMSRVLQAGVAGDTMQYQGVFLTVVDATRPLTLHGTPVTLGRF